MAESADLTWQSDNGRAGRSERGQARGVGDGLKAVALAGEADALPLAENGQAASGWAPALGTWLTVERALIGGVLLLAALMRLWVLGDLPLQSDEAATALEAWRIAEGQAGNVSAGPLLVYGNALIFFAFGANDAAPRILPALAGIALVALPLLLRHRLGRTAALIAAVLMLFSPTLIYVSRLADSTALLAAATAGAAIMLYEFAFGRDRRSLYGSAVALGLLMLSGPGSYAMLLVMAIPAVVAGRLVFQAIDPYDLRKAALLAGGIVVVGATGLLGNWHGVQEGLVAPFERLLGPSFVASDMLRPLQMLALYEPLLLAFGLAGAVQGLLKRDRLCQLLSWWALAALVVAILSGERSATALTLALVPLALLAGRAVERAIKGLSEGVSKAEAGGYLGANFSLLALFWITSQFFTLPGNVLPATVPFGSSTLSLQALGEIIVRGEIVLILAAVVALPLWVNGRKMASLIALLGLVVLGLVTFHTGMLLGYNGSPAEVAVAARTSTDMRAMAREIAAAVDALAEANRPRAIRVAVEESVVQWYLRDQPGVNYSARPGNEAIVVAEAEAEPPPGRFAANRFRLQQQWSGEKSVAGSWRWLTLREATLQSRDLVVYIRMPG